MDDDRNEKIRRLFNAALKHERSKQAAFLSEACAADPSLRQEVESLLAAYQEAPGFLEEPEGSEPIRFDDNRGTGRLDLEQDLDLPFERLGEFKLIHRLGEGGMGIVYLAEQESLSRPVALKVIRHEWMGSIEAQIRFMREVHAVAKLRHPNIVTVLGSGQEKGVHYFAMEFVPGEGLDAVLRRAPPQEDKVPVQEILGWILAIARALDCAHANGIIHRDVKPSNIRITPEGRAMLLDFSVARHSKLSAMTLTGEFRGTPYYASPEQVKARSRDIDARTDVYSLGVTLFEAMTGRVPFEGETTQHVFRQILEKEPISPRKLNPAISRDLATVIQTAMEKKPEHRYLNMKEFAGDLQRLLADEPVSARPAGWVRKSAKWIRRHRYASLFAGALFLVLAVVLTLVLVVAEQKRTRILEAMKRFKPINEALERPDFQTSGIPWRWCLDAAPYDPGGYMLQAIIDIGSGALEDAAGNLKECIARCRESREIKLENESHYLLSLVQLARAEDTDENLSSRAKLIEEAESELKKAGAFDPTSPEVLVLRKADLFALFFDAIQPELQNIRLNPEHYLVQLYLGLNIFQDLYKGGSRGRFDKAIEHFDNVLKARSENTTALTFQGRSYYFLARFYNFLDLMESAEQYLNHALVAAGQQPYHMIYTTLGQISLLRGDLDKAFDYFNKAIEMGQDERHIHNAFGGIGKVYARKGMYEEALEWYEEALKRERTDVHVKMSIAELYLFRGDIEKALEVLDQILGFFAQTPRTQIAGVYLLSVRVHLEKEQYGRALEELEKIDRIAIHSPRDLSLACIIMATFPDDWTAKLESLSTRLADKANFNARFEEYTSPICLSGLGAAAFLRGEYPRAIDYFEKAISERERWPPDVKSYHWAENVRDWYFLAMAHVNVSGAARHETVDSSAARRFFQLAEEAFRAKEPTFEAGDILMRVRDKARGFFGLDR